MKRYNHKGAIELSANFIIVIIISVVIVVGGLAMFFKLKSNLNDLVDTLDDQTTERIKNMMLSGSEHVAVYPTGPTIVNGDAKLVGIGITNIYNGPNSADFQITVTDITYFDKPDSDGSPAPLSFQSYYQINTPTITIPPHGQIVKGLFLKMPSGSPKGQYAYTIEIQVDDGTGYRPYGILQVYANNP